MTATVLDGLTVRQFLAINDNLLGGGSDVIDIVDADILLASLNNAFDDGNASSFAQQHLISGACP